MDPFDQTAPWSMESIRGCAKFLDRVWNLQTILIDGNEYSAKFEQMMHRAIKKVSSDIEDMKFNTCISTFMTMVNEFYKEKSINKVEFKTFLQLLNPFAPHESNDFAYMDWPEYDVSKTIANEITLPIQFNGKLKGTVQILLNEDETSVKEKVHNVVDLKLNGRNIIKEIYVKNKIYNIVVK